MRLPSELDFPQAPVFSYKQPLTSIFPDGLKTSGQCAPDYDRLFPYSSFPRRISGDTVWVAEEYKDNPERWTHHFSNHELAELSEAADSFIASGTPLTGIIKVAPLARA